MLYIESAKADRLETKAAVGLSVMVEVAITTTVDGTTTAVRVVNSVAQTVDTGRPPLRGFVLGVPVTVVRTLPAGGVSVLSADNIGTASIVLVDVVVGIWQKGTPVLVEIGVPEDRMVERVALI